MSSNTRDEKRSSIDEVHRRIGRNLLRFLEMETALRLVLPYIDPNASNKGIDAMHDYQKEHVNKATLRPLFKQFNEATKVPHGFFGLSADEIVGARNDLVHHFYKLPNVDLLKPEGLDMALTWLDKQFKESEDWFQYLRVQSLFTLLALMESNPILASQYGLHHEKLLAQLPPGFEYIDKGDPTRTSWATSRIVRLLKQAELHTEKRNGFTLLARAGMFIKSTSPEIAPEEYGLRTLKDVLVASGMFEVAVEADGNTVAFRSIGETPSNLSMDDAQLMRWTLVREKQ